MLGLSVIQAYADGALPEHRLTAARVLKNLAANPRNRTALYKSELTKRTLDLYDAATGAAAAMQLQLPVLVPTVDGGSTTYSFTVLPVSGHALCSRMRLRSRHGPLRGDSIVHAPLISAVPKMFLNSFHPCIQVGR